MIRAVSIIAGFAATLAVSPALACSPAPMKPSAKAIRGEACSLKWHVSEHEMVGITGAQAIAPGFVWQETYEGNTCNGSVTLVVQECGSGRVLLLGEASFDLMVPGSSKRLVDLFEGAKKAGAKPGFGLELVAAQARRHGVTGLREVTTGDRIRMAGKTVPLDCGCKTLFPGMGDKE